MKKKLKIFVDSDKKFKPNLLFENVQKVFHPLTKTYEIIVLYWRTQNDHFDIIAERRMNFTTTDEEEAKRTFRILKNMYYGK